MLCCAIWAMDICLDLLVGNNILEDLLNRFSLVNIIGNSFLELFTCPAIHSSLAFKVLPVNNAKLCYFSGP